MIFLSGSFRLGVYAEQGVHAKEQAQVAVQFHVATDQREPTYLPPANGSPRTCLSRSSVPPSRLQFELLLRPAETSCV